jgi:hypothetical protein
MSGALTPIDGIDNLCGTGGFVDEVNETPGTVTVGATWGALELGESPPRTTASVVTATTEIVRTAPLVLNIISPTAPGMLLCAHSRRMSEPH